MERVHFIHNINVSSIEFSERLKFRQYFDQVHRLSVVFLHIILAVCRRQLEHFMFANFLMKGPKSMQWKLLKMFEAHSSICCTK